MIGLETTVESPHAGWNGLRGRIVDETKSTFLVETASGAEIRVPKPGQRFVFADGDGRSVVTGNEITFRPEDRTKKVRG